MHNHPIEVLSDDSEFVLPPQPQPPPLAASSSSLPQREAPPTSPIVGTPRPRAALLLSGTRSLTRRVSSSATSSGGGVSSRASSVDVLGAGVGGVLRGALREKTMQTRWPTPTRRMRRIKHREFPCPRSKLTSRPR
ncbi:hypothetical protein CPC08DRAFT_769951 [Agrocybe pediades]|nr:hypothetical protein CPC08DRAFT_769951 [Agrocybe pediades]